MKHLLFVCTHNAGRSQMAKAFWDMHGPDDIRAESAGQSPVNRPWPEVVEVMRQVGVDISDVRPQKLTRELQLEADWAVTLGCEGVCPYVPTRVENWPLDDPHGRPLGEVRRIRDDVERHVLGLVEHRLDEIREDATAQRSGWLSSCGSLETSSRRPIRPRRSGPAPIASSGSTPESPYARS